MTPDNNNEKENVAPPSSPAPSGPSAPVTIIINAPEMMTFQDAVVTCLKNYSEFSGSASRAEYWWFILFCILLNAGLHMISPVLAFIARLLLIIPQIAVSVRRLHDINRSGWYYLLNLLPCFGWLIVVYLHVQPSAEDDKQHGPPFIILFVVNLIASGIFAVTFDIPGYYKQFQNRLNFQAVIDQAQPYKDAVSRCIRLKNTVEGCNAGTNDIPPPITTPTDAVSSLSVTDGVITVAPRAHGTTSESDILIMRPMLRPDSTIGWTFSGAAISKKLTDPEDLLDDEIK